MIDDDNYVAPKTPFDYISRDQLQDMWGAGFTVIRRNAFGDDLYQIADRVCKAGMAQQWADKSKLKEFLASGWNPVPCERHFGLFAPWGYIGRVEIGGLVLVECPAHKVEKAKEAQVAAANKLVTEWQEKYNAVFSGEATVGSDTVQMIGETKTIENTTAIPRELTPYIAQIFAERDRLGEQFAAECTNSDSTEFSSELMAGINALFQAELSRNPVGQKWPMLNAILLPRAIENIRKLITEEAESGQAS